MNTYTLSIPFLPIKTQMTNENAGHYLHMLDAGQRVKRLCRLLQYNIKLNTWSHYVRYCED